MRCSFVVVLLLAHGWESPAAEHRARSVRVTVLSTMLATRGIGEWGFAAIVEVDGRRILFDTGAIAGLTWWNFYCQFFKGSIRSPQVVEFLKHLMRHIPGPMILIWDRLSAHKSRMVQNFIAERHGRIHTEYVPVSGSDLNLVEYLWGHGKQHEQRLSKGLVGLERTSPPNFTENQPTPPADCCFLEAG